MSHNSVASASASVKPPIKWVGGKTQILPSIMTHFPTEMENYYEPFVGGGSVLIYLLENVKKGTIVVKGTIYACDLNETLIWMYKNIQGRPQELITELTRLDKDMKIALSTSLNGNRTPVSIEEALTSSESYYYFIRSKYNSLSQTEKNTPHGSAMFIFLNKTGFRGLHRTGPNGFNVPFGNYKSPTICDKDNILALSQLFSGVEFMHQDYKLALDKVRAGDFVYMDPPYVPENATSFVKYNVDGFNEREHLTLFERCKQLAANDVYFLLSNSDTKMVRDAFSSLICETIGGCRRAINSTNPSATTNELIIHPDIMFL